MSSHTARKSKGHACWELKEQMVSDREKNQGKNCSLLLKLVVCVPHCTKKESLYFFFEDICCCMLRIIIAVVLKAILYGRHALILIFLLNMSRIWSKNTVSNVIFLPWGLAPKNCFRHGMPSRFDRHVWISVRGIKVVGNVTGCLCIYLYLSNRIRPNFWWDSPSLYQQTKRFPGWCNAITHVVLCRARRWNQSLWVPSSWGCYTINF